MRRCIERLWTVSVIAEANGIRQGFRLLSGLVIDERRGKLAVALNPHLTRAILGEGQYTQIDMQEIRALRSDVARLVHQRLCAVINAGSKRVVAIDTLCSYAWPEQANTNTMHKRRQRLATAIQELREINWNAEERLRGKFHIQRPRK
ncbi:replication protein C, IncQ-type [Pandoraea norimbergensis]|uniref:replication protein C, IncQ-type n=1 Tax=Pandoraea norimbergensis TaxID=93219 RepID=UPI00389957C9